MFRFLLFFSVGSLLYADITPKQLKTLQTVRDIARTIPDHKGETYENTLSAICLTESSGGMRLIGDFKKGVDITRASLGAMQIQVDTAKHIAALTPSLNYLLQYDDRKLASLLITDLKISVRIAAHLLARLKKSRDKYYYMVSGYNGGWKNKPYFKRVMKNYRYVQKLVKKGQLL